MIFEPQKGEKCFSKLFVIFGCVVGKWKSDSIKFLVRGQPTIFGTNDSSHTTIYCQTFKLADNASQHTPS